MRPTITDADALLTPEMLARAEAQLGFRLPADYVAFLQASNGGRPRPDVVSTPAFPGSAAADVQRFYGIEARLECYDLVAGYRIWTRDSPANLLPIACDSGGSAFCLSVQGDDVGRVYYRDWHREPHPVRTRYPWTYPVADSLAEFLESFREPSPEERAEVEASQFSWHTDWITAEVRRDDRALQMGQYLHLTQHLPPGETGWTMKKMDIPESWSVRCVEVSDGVITIRTEDGRVFRLTRHNVGDLDYAILDGGSKTDEELEQIWRERAEVRA